MLNLINIARGWYDFIKADSYTKALMEKRLEICNNCDKRQEINKLGQVLIKAIHEDGNTFRCGECGCPLAGLTAAPAAACSLGKWKAAGDESYY